LKQSAKLIQQAEDAGYFLTPDQSCVVELAAEDVPTPTENQTNSDSTNHHTTNCCWLETGHNSLISRTNAPYFKQLLKTLAMFACFYPSSTVN
jgi:hypothetical protein